MFYRARNPGGADAWDRQVKDDEREGERGSGGGCETCGAWVSKDAKRREATRVSEKSWGGYGLGKCRMLILGRQISWHADDSVLKEDNF